MKLTTEVREALERWHRHDYLEVQGDDVLADMAQKADAMLLANGLAKMFPPGYHDPITPERLVELGGVLAQMSEVVCFESCAEFWFSGCDIRQLHVYDNCRTAWIRIPSHLQPRNMGEVLELVERCKGGE